MQELGWPLFMKGNRQTARHLKSLSIIEGPEQWRQALKNYREDPILRWQPVVCRQFVPLRPVPETSSDRIPASFEFRTFWWKGELVGEGRYWWGGPSYDWSAQERADAVAIAREAARRMRTPFLVVDVAQTVDGKWIGIECNDGQESGYAGVSPFSLWQNILRFERRSGPRMEEQIL